MAIENVGERDDDEWHEVLEGGQRLIVIFEEIALNPLLSQYGLSLSSVASFQTSSTP